MFNFNGNGNECSQTKLNQAETTDTNNYYYALSKDGEKLYKLKKNYTFVSNIL
jgi:hypothetical protein